MSKLKTFLKFFLLFFFLLGIKTYAQKSQSVDSLVGIAVDSFEKLRVESNEKIIISLSVKIDSIFIEIFSDEKSFYNEFSELKNYCSVLSSDDGFFRIITWNIFLYSGEYKYFGYIQYKPLKSEFLFYRLNDQSNSILHPEYENLSYKKWFGCVYYNVITQKKGKKTFYNLLGWDGNNLLTNKKIVEVISFKNNKPDFGYNFDLNGKKYKRLIFEYNEQANMILRWDEKMKMIVWDHLAPKESKYTGMYQFYGPDFTYDGLKFKKKKWNYLENIVLTNDQEK